MNHTDPQPSPAHTSESVPVWPLAIYTLTELTLREDYPDSMIPAAAKLCIDAQRRDTEGRAKYGVPLSTHNGRDHLIDAYQEALDLYVYLYAECLEREPTAPPDYMAGLTATASSALTTALELAQLILMRESINVPNGMPR